MRTGKAIQILIPLHGNSMEEEMFYEEPKLNRTTGAEGPGKALKDPLDEEHEDLQGHIMDVINNLGRLLSESKHRQSIFDSSKSVGIVDVDREGEVVPRKRKKRA